MDHPLRTALGYDSKLPFQAEVFAWCIACFGEQVTVDKQERGYRFTEESLELAQATGITKDEVLELVNLVFSKPVGEPKQEIGGTAVTLFALGTSHGLNVNDCADEELSRVWRNIDKIRAKHKSKKTRGPLPGEN